LRYDSGRDDETPGGRAAIYIENLHDSDVEFVREKKDRKKRREVFHAYSLSRQ